MKTSHEGMHPILIGRMPSPVMRMIQQNKSEPVAPALEGEGEEASRAAGILSTFRMGGA